MSAPKPIKTKTKKSEKQCCRCGTAFRIFVHFKMINCFGLCAYPSHKGCLKRRRRVRSVQTVGSCLGTAFEISVMQNLGQQLIRKLLCSLFNNDAAGVGGRAGAYRHGCTGDTVKINDHTAIRTGTFKVCEHFVVEELLYPAEGECGEICAESFLYRF